MNKDLIVFSNKIHAIVEADYGDFMRLGNNYLLQLREQLEYLQDQNINSKLHEIQDYLQFRPTWNVESTRTRLDVDIKFMDQILAGHSQDLES